MKTIKLSYILFSLAMIAALALATIPTAPAYASLILPCSRAQALAWQMTIHPY